MQLFVNGPEHRLSKMLLQAEGADGDADETQLGDRSVDFLHCGIDILKRHEPDPFEARALGADARDPIVVAAAKSRGVIFLRQLSDAESAGGEENRDVDSLFVHVAEPRRHVGDVHAELPIHAGVPHVVGEKRPLSSAIGFRHKLPDIGVAVANVAVGVDDPHVSQVWNRHDNLLELKMSTQSTGVWQSWKVNSCSYSTHYSNTPLHQFILRTVPAAALWALIAVDTLISEDGLPYQRIRGQWQ